MIKFNNSDIIDWNFDDNNIIKVYHNGAIVFYKFDSEQGGYKVCYAVVDDITQYSETEFEDVYDKATEKWYKLNNLNQYEEYGVYASGRTSCEGSSRLPQGYTEVEYIENTGTTSSNGAYLNLGLPLYDTIGNSFQISSRLKSEFYSASGYDDLETIINSESVSSPYYGFVYRYTHSTHNIELAANPSNHTTLSTTANTDGTTSITISCNSTSVTDQVPLGLFASYNANYNTPYRFAKATIYSLTVVKNGDTVRDLVPAKRDSDDKYGMYDLVTNTFYLSPNNVDFSGGEPVTPTDCVTTYEGKLTIDDGYEYEWNGSSWVNLGEVSGSSITIKSPEYISKTSSVPNGRLDLGYSLKDNTRFQIKVKPTYSGGGLVLGQYNATSDNNDYRIFWYLNSLYYDYGSDRKNVSQAINNTYEYEVGNYYVKNLATSANVLTGTTKSGVATSMDRKISLWDTGSANDRAEIYYTKIYEGDTLIRDFIPWTDMNGNYGMFDKVSMSVFNSTNQLTGSSNVTDVEVGGGYDYPVYYDEKSDPLDNLTFNTLAEAQAYAEANCVYDGMHATIGTDRYYFDSTDENGWVKILEYYKFEDVTPGGSSGWTISGSSTYNPDSSYYDDFDLQTTSTSYATKIAKVTIYGYDHFTYYLRSYNQYSSSYGYVMASNIDELSTDPTSMSYSSNSAITNTYNFNKTAGSAVNLSNYRRVTYNNLDKTVEHTFYVVFYGRTYSSYVSNATILIPKEQTNENWEQVSFSASSNVASLQKSLYLDGNNSSSGGTGYFYYRWMVGLPAGSHNSYTNYSNYNYCPNVTSSTFTSVAGNSRRVNYTYDNTTNKNLSMRLVDSGGNVLSPSDTVYYYMYRYNSCNISSNTTISLPSTQSVKVGGRFSFGNSYNRHYIYGYTAPATGTTYYVDNYSSTFDLVYTALTRESVSVTYTTYDPNDSETPAFKTDITWPYNGGTTSSTTLTSYDVPYTYSYTVSQTSNMFSASTASYTYTAGQSSRTISFTLYPNNREFATVTDLETYAYAWEGMKAKVGDTNYKYENGEWVEITSKDSDFVIGDFNTFVSSSTEVTEGYYIIYYYGYNSSYADKNYLLSWNSGNTWSGYYTLGNMNHRDVNTSVPISSSEIIDDAVWELKDAGNGNFYIRNVGTNKYWYYLGTNTNYGVPLTDNANNATPVSIQDWRNHLAFVEKQNSSNNPLNRLYAYSYRYGWYSRLATDGNNEYYMRKYVP